VAYSIADLTLRTRLILVEFGFFSFGLAPNAQAHLLPEADARHERTLEAVRCSAVLGVSVTA
jgi:hypothetical protein